MGCDCTKCQNSSIWGVFWMNKVQIVPNVIGRWKVEGKLLVLSDGSEAMIWQEKERSRIREFCWV